MGCTTEFTGRVTVEPPLNRYEVAYLRRFVGTRRMLRDRGPYYTGTGPWGQDQEADITSYNSPPEGQPGLWCQWVPTDDSTGIEWDGGEKFYDATEWMRYLIDTFLKPGAVLQRELPNPVEGRYYPSEFTHFTFDHIVNGVIDAAGAQDEDRWQMVVTDNTVVRVEVDLAGGDPAVQALIDDGWLGYPDEQITAGDLARVVDLVRAADRGTAPDRTRAGAR